MLEQIGSLIANGQLAEAEVGCRQHLKRQPRDAEVRQKLAQCLHLTAEHDAAARELRTCLRTAPREPSLHIGLANVLAWTGETEAAIRHARAACDLAPNDPGAVSCLVDLYRRHGQFDEARGLLAPHLGHPGAPPSFIAAFGSIEHQSGNHERAVEILGHGLEQPGLSPSLERLMHLTRGRAYDALGEYDRAFAAFAAGNTVETVSFDHEACTKRFDTLIGFFTRTRLEQLSGARAIERPVFVLGMPRSGTTLVEQIIAAHPDAEGAGELETIPRLIDRLPLQLAGGAYPACLAAMTPAFADERAAEYLERAPQRAREAERFVDKYLLNTEHLGFIQSILPGSKVIHCTRHPMDVGLSCFMAGLKPAWYPWASRLDDIGAYLAQTQRIMEHWNNVLDLPIHEASYEAMLEAPEAETRAVVEHVGLPWHDDCLRFHASGRTVMTLSYDQVRRPIYQSAKARYRNYEQHLGPLRERLGELAEG